MIKPNDIESPWWYTCDIESPRWYYLWYWVAVIHDVSDHLVQLLISQIRTSIIQIQSQHILTVIGDLKPQIIKHMYTPLLGYSKTCVEGHSKYPYMTMSPHHSWLYVFGGRGRKRTDADGRGHFFVYLFIFLRFFFGWAQSPTAWVTPLPRIIILWRSIESTTR